MDSQKNPTQKWIILIIVVILLGGLVAFMMSKRAETTETTEETPVTSEQPTPATPPVTQPTPGSITSTPTTQKSAYKDGTYSATGNYVSPGGSESVDVTLVLKDDVVTDVTVTGNANNPTSKNWQTRFIAGVKGEVVGKKLDALNLSVVSGSSLTPVGFMDAVEKIKVQARV